MAGSEFDSEQQETRQSHLQSQELQFRHHHLGHLDQLSEKLEKRQRCTDHMLDKQLLEELICNRGGRKDSQAFEIEEVTFCNNRHSQVSEQVRLSRHVVEDCTFSSVAALKKRKSTHLEGFEKLTQRANLESAKLLGELSAEAALTGTKRSSDIKISVHPSRFCRIRNKKFSSGRALGGHMRVHGPALFTPGSKSRSRRVLHLTANHASMEEDDDNLDDDEETPSIVDAFEAKLADIKDAAASSEQASLSSDDDGYGELDSGRADYHDKYDQERGLLSMACNSEIAGTDDDGAANSAATKSLLYKLRHNPKRSRRFADQEFALESQQSLVDLIPVRNSIPAEGVRVCSECGKAFWSEKALFGHMRCHPEREWRGVLPPEGSLEQRTGAMARFRRKRALAVQKLMEKPEFKSKFDVGKEEDIAVAELEAVINIKEGSLHMKAAGKVIITEEDDAGRETEVMQSGEEQPECVTSGIDKMMNDFAPRWRGRRSRRRVVGKAGSMETSSLSPEEEPALTSESISLELGEEQELETPDCLILLAEAAKKIEEDMTLQSHQVLLGTGQYTYSLKDLKKGMKNDLIDEALHPFNGAGEDQDDAGEPEEEELEIGLVSKYECTTCKKSFNTHQALGGHRASHKKTKGCFARTSLSELTGEHTFAEEPELGPVQEKDMAMLHPIHKRKKKQLPTQPSDFKGHACSICHRIFLTGQALGGHKRCHWTGEKASEAASVVSTNKQSSLQSEGQYSKIIEGGIDLNMPAPMDEEDEVGYGSTDLHSVFGDSAHDDVETEKRDVGSLQEPSEVIGNSALPAWTSVTGLLRDDITSSSMLSLVMKREIEARRRFDGIWGQHWPNNNGVAEAQ